MQQDQTLRIDGWSDFASSSHWDLTESAYTKAAELAMEELSTLLDDGVRESSNLSGNFTLASSGSSYGFIFCIRTD